MNNSNCASYTIACKHRTCIFIQRFCPRIKYHKNPKIYKILMLSLSAKTQFCVVELRVVKALKGTIFINETTNYKINNFLNFLCKREDVIHPCYASLSLSALSSSLSFSSSIYLSLSLSPSFSLSLSFSPSTLM